MAAGGDAVVRAAVARALKESFPYVRVFHSAEGWGYHFLASESPLPNPTAAELAQRLPAKAAIDFLEWGPETTLKASFRCAQQRNLTGRIDCASSLPRLPCRTTVPSTNTTLMRHRAGSRH